MIGRQEQHLTNSYTYPNINPDICIGGWSRSVIIMVELTVLVGAIAELGEAKWCDWSHCSTSPGSRLDVPGQWRMKLWGVTGAIAVLHLEADWM